MKLTLHNLTKEYTTLRGAVKALRGIHLTVEPGEFFVLLGPSGCGKSTLLNLVAGLEKPTDGEIRMGDRLVASGRDRYALPPGERDVAMVFQSYALYPHMSVEENIAFPLKVAGMGKAKRKEEVHRVSRLLEIEELRERKPAELSGGQRQRVAIARALVRNPSLFLLDEPLSNLDARLRTGMRAGLKQLQRELGVTTLYVTHDQTEAMTLGDRIALLREGEVVQVGSPLDLYHRPLSPFAARFVGTLPMNLAGGILRKEEGRLLVRRGGISLRLPSPGKEGFPSSSLSSLPDGAAVMLGFRPEHTRLASAGEEGIPGRIHAIEPLGRETLVHVRTEWGDLLVLVESDEKGEPGTGVTDGSSSRPGDAVSLRPVWRRLHIFEGEDGRRI